MGLTTGIEWTDATWNPWTGCEKVSPACTNCYMFAGMRRYGKDPKTVTRSGARTFQLPLQRDRTGAFKIPPGSKVFVCSWSDFFHTDADEFRPDAWDLMRQRPDLIFQLVTKRTDRIGDCLPPDWGNGWPNVWLLATVENQHWADIRIPQLLQVPAVVRGLSVEPMLEDIDLYAYLYATAPNTAGPWRYPSGRIVRSSGIGGHMMSSRPANEIHWIIGGGESGPKSRITHPRWSRNLRDQSQLAGVAFFYKQHGEWVGMDDFDPFTMPRIDDCQTVNMLPNGLLGREVTAEVCRQLETLPTTMIRVGKKAAGRLLDGREWSEFPNVPAAVS